MTIQSQAAILTARLTAMALLGATLVATPAAAADMPAKAPVYKAPAAVAVYNWTGFYAGLNAGYGWGGGDTTFSGLPDPATFFSLATQTLKPDPKGIIGGGQLGYNWQTGRTVVGLEADFQLSDMNGSVTRSPILDITGAPSPTGFLQASQRTDWFGTLRARAGYTPADRWLVYVTGGLAYAKVNYSATTDFRPAGAVFYAASVSKTKVGWTLGGGTELALGDNWTAKLEYLYYDLGKETFVANPNIVLPPFQVQYESKTNAHIARVGLNYLFRAH